MSVTYKPKEHFQGWIDKFAGKLHVDVQVSEVVEHIRRHVTHEEQITHEDISKALKQYSADQYRKYANYYHHVQLIVNLIRGEQTEQLYDLHRDGFTFPSVLDDLSRRSGLLLDGDMGSSINKSKHTLDKYEECPICLENVEYEEDKTRCGHYFHPKCISKWTCISHTCPICRNEI